MSPIQDIIAVSETSSMPLPAHALRKLGRDLALVRRKRGISPSDMAARLFVSRDTLWRLERGDPTIALGTCLQEEPRPAPLGSGLVRSTDESRSGGKGSENASKDYLKPSPRSGPEWRDSWPAHEA